MQNHLTKMTKGKRYLTKDIGPPSCIPYNYKDELLSPEDKKLLCLFLLLLFIWQLGKLAGISFNEKPT